MSQRLRPRPESPSRTRALEAALRRAVTGDVLFGPGDRALYSTDSSNYRQVPIGVVRPANAADVEAAIAVCREFEAPVTLRGGGTSLAGQATNRAVVLDASRYMSAILEVDERRRRAVVEPGLVLDRLRSTADRVGLTFGPDPATHDRCTIGGMIGNDSCGVHSIMAGRTSANVQSLDVLTYDGERLTVGPTSDEELEAMLGGGGRRAAIYTQLVALRDRYGPLIRERFPVLPRRVSGFALDALLPENGFDVARALVGTEGTCATVLSATLRLVESPPGRAIVVLGYPDVFAAADDVMRVLATGAIGLEGFDDRLVDACRRKGMHAAAIAQLPPGSGWLVVEYGAETPESAAEQARRVAGRAPAAVVVTDPAGQSAIWALRESAVGATSIVPGKSAIWPGWEDSAVPPDRLSAYLRDLDRLIVSFGFERTYYGHFGDGCLHMRTDFDFRSEAGTSAFRRFMEEAADLVVSYGGSLSGEHGDGQARGELLERMYGPELVRAFGEFKAIWDAGGRMNPGKVIDPYPLDADIRGARRLETPATVFRFPTDGGSIANAAMRCVGVGKCRRDEGGLMCPSYQATREERHSTRGRARLLFEMLDGEVVPDLWRSDAVYEALDLCLACKGCKTQCPTQVDMAAYKAEFMAHHFAGRLRPRAAYSMGLIHWWAHLARIAPGLANAVGSGPGIGALAKLVAGVDGRRSIPAFAGRSFRPQLPAGVGDLGASRGHPRRVVLFADTFTDGFVPSQGLAAVRVLQAAGWTVEVPRANLCCGRPLYDWGFLGQARRLLRQVLDTLGPELESGVEVVVLEPSCAAVFRDELLQLFPADPRAKRLAAQTRLFAEFVAAHRPGFPSGALAGPAILHGHCHQKAVFGMDDETAVVRSLGLSPEQPEEGCCGMAGAFGFERGEHYEIAMKLGERALLPAVRSAEDGVLVLADGFSCREQIEQGTGRRALHLAEVVDLAVRDRQA